LDIVKKILSPLRKFETETVSRSRPSLETPSLVSSHKSVGRWLIFLCVL